MPVDLRLMRYVIAVAEEQSFQRAAARLHIAQPPLSRQIRQLEHELGVALFHRRPTRLTDAGRVFVDASRDIVAAAEGAVARTRAAAGALERVVRVGYGPTTTWEEMPRLIAAMDERRPGITVEARELWDVELITALAEGSVDVALGRLLPTPPGCETEPLRREPFVAVVAAEDPLAARESVALRELRGYALQTFERGLAPEYHDALVAAAQSTGERFEVWPAPIPGLRDLGLRPGRFCLLAESVAARLPGKLAALTVADRLPRIELQLLWRPKAAPPAAHALVGIARELARDHAWAG